MTTIVRNSYLASVLANPRGARPTAAHPFRRYRANIRTESVVGGLNDARHTQVSYEVGRAPDTKGAALRTAPDGLVRVEAAYPTSATLAEDFIGLAKKYSNFSASFEFSSLAGVAERLARGLAAASVFPDVIGSDLRGNNPLNISVLGTQDGPVNSLTNAVFIPRLVNSVITGDVFTVLVNAVAGEGSAVVTDVLELDAATRDPIMGVVQADGFPRAVVEALRIVGANMIAADQGPLFAFAVTRGVHRVLSVVGHTDEGGITRDWLRASGFAPPFGGIHYGLPVYSGLPALSSTAVADIAAYVDCIALTSAALVAHSDPGITYDDRWYPSFYQGTSADTPEVRPGQHQDSDADIARRNWSQWSANMPRFLDFYLNGLGKLFGAEGSTQVAGTVGRTHATLMGIGRHFDFASIAPFYWIEPTSLIPHDFLGSPAETHGSGAYATVDVPREKGAFEDLAEAGASDVAYSAYNVLMRNPRSAWFFAHWLGHPQNGLGAISVRQLDPNGIIHPGACDQHPDVRDRVEAALPWTSFMWVRGQSPFPAPGELLNLSGTAGFMVRHLTFDDDAIPTPEHVPTSREFLATSVRLVCGRPMSIANGPSNSPDSTARRARTRAARELAAATARARLFGRPAVAEMPILTTAPVMRTRPAAPPPQEPPQVGGGVVGWMRGSKQAETGVDERERDGEPVRAVPHYDAQRHPAIARAQAGAVIGGGQAPPGPGAPGDEDDNQPPQPVAVGNAN